MHGGTWQQLAAGITTPLDPLAPLELLESLALTLALTLTVTLALTLVLALALAVGTA